jgi:hypothetical protein
MNMAFVISCEHLKTLGEEHYHVFEKSYFPGEDTPHSGIYRCKICNQNEASVKGMPLPSEHHNPHENGKPIEWHLIVAAHTIS